MHHSHRLATATWCGAVALVLAACSSTPPAVEPEPMSASAAQPAMTPEEMMVEMQRLGTPGEGHQRLEAMVGTFEAAGTFWMEPDAPPITSEGTSTHVWILGGRFVRQDYSASFMGSPFEGIGITGFNNASGKYEGVWIDNMVTTIMPVSTGTVDETGKVITFSRVTDHPLTGEPTKSREVLTIASRDQHSFEWFETGPDGVERKTMEITYTRTQ